VPAQTLFGQPASPSALTQDTGSYSMGMQFTLSQNAPLTGIWWWSPPGAVGLPLACGIYQVTGPGTGTAVPGTVVSGASWSGAAGSGWVKHAYDGSVILQAGTTYKVVISNGGAGEFFYGGTSHYWDTTGPGANGLTSGIITAPDNAGGDGGQDTFATTTVLTYPSTSFGAANYWVDVEVSVSSSPPQITTATLPVATETQAYSATLQATGGTAPYTWSVSAGSLPSWASLDSSTGVISGTAPAYTQVTTFTVKVTDAVASTDTQQLTLTVGTPPVGYPPGGPWVTVFNEDFDNPVGGKPDPAVWADHLIEGDAIRTNTGGTEVEWYPHNRAGLSVSGSVLSLTARFESPYDPASAGYDPLAPDPLPGGQAGQVTSGMIQSHPGFQFTYGFAEASCKLPLQPFTWPAFWMFAADAAWPPEFDMFEQFDTAEQFSQTYHTITNAQQSSTDSSSATLDTAFHTYGVAWSPTAITFYFDGAATFSVDTATYPVVSLPMHLVVNFAVQAGLTGAGFPCSMEVDYVRAWVTDGVPAQPVISSVSPPDGIPTNGTLTVTFGAVSGAASYRATPCPVDEHADGSPATRLAVTGTTSPLVITGLTNGARYTASVSAVNATGYSIESALAPALPSPVTGSETPSGSDAAQIAVAGAESGSGADAGSLTASVPGPEAAAGAEGQAVTATLQGAETGAGTDTATAVPVLVLPPAGQLGGTAVNASTYGGTAS